MEEAYIYQGLAGIFREVFGCDVALHAGLTAADVPGWDSFRQVGILLGVEERFGVHLHVRDVKAMRTVGDLVGLLAACA